MTYRRLGRMTTTTSPLAFHVTETGSHYTLPEHQRSLTASGKIVASPCVTNWQVAAGRPQAHVATLGSSGATVVAFVRTRDAGGGIDAATHQRTGILPAR